MSIIIQTVYTNFSDFCSLFFFSPYTHIFCISIRMQSLEKQNKININRYTAAHTLDLYSEVASICRPPLALTGSEMGSFAKSQTPATGYIISVFKVFEGDDGERFEKNWLYWTGARMLYRCKRFSIHFFLPLFIL